MKLNVFLLLATWWLYSLGIFTQHAEEIDVSELEKNNVHASEKVWLRNALHSLDKGLQYMEKHKSEINLDGVFGVRLVEELFGTWLQHNENRMHVLGHQWWSALVRLQQKARTIADSAIPFIRENEPKYYAKIGKILHPSTHVPWYPSRSTDAKYLEKRVPCEKAAFNETFSDICLRNIISPPFESSERKIKLEQSELLRKCSIYMTQRNQTGYVLTHQVLYHQLLQKFQNNPIRENLDFNEPMNGLDSKPEVTLCTNVLRDAEETAKNEYPLNHRDLFMEQIGLCGYWGFKDFYKLKWLQDIISWQQPSGCYTNYAHWQCTDHMVPDGKLRVKRVEKILKDNCLSHKTTVALLAIAVSIRFSAEKISITETDLDEQSYVYYD